MTWRTRWCPSAAATARRSSRWAADAPPMDVCRDFRGREPTTDALLRNVSAWQRRTAARRTGGLELRLAGLAVQNGRRINGSERSCFCERLSGRAVQRHDLAHAVVSVGRRYRETILALGGRRLPMDVYRAFRGREPARPTPCCGTSAWRRRAAPRRPGGVERLPDQRGGTVVLLRAALRRGGTAP